MQHAVLTTHTPFFTAVESRIIDADEIYHWCSENCPKSIISGNQQRINPLAHAALNVQLWGGVRWIRLQFTETQHNFRKDKTEQISRLVLHEEQQKHKKDPESTGHCLH